MTLFSGTPKDRLVALINAQNPSLPIPITKKNLYFGRARLDPVSTDGVSSIVPTVGVLGTQYSDYADFHYKRINLSTAYDTVPAFYGVGADTLYGMLDDVNRFLGLNMTEQDVADVQIGYTAVGTITNITIQALPGSLAYTGSMVLEFHRQQPQLSQVIRQINLGVQTYDNVDPTKGKLDIGMLMWSVDFSPFLSTLKVLPNNTWKDFAGIQAIVKTEFGFNDWPAPPDQGVADYATVNYPGANTNFQRVAVQTGVVGSTYLGTGLFHYNPS